MASKRRLRRKKCGSKFRHKTLEGAQIVIKKLKTGAPMSAYRCKHCGFFHIGHYETSNPKFIPRVRSTL